MESCCSTSLRESPPRGPWRRRSACWDPSRGATPARSIHSVKSDLAILRLGEETATGDTESPILHRREIRVDDARIADVLAVFLGVKEQIPPMHSALHVGGRRLCEYARAGEEVERLPRQ